MKDNIKRETIIRRRVLVVDDEAINRQLLGFIVSREYEVDYCENGLEAMRYINDNADGVSLILLDLQMPDMDGYQVLESMREDPVLRRIPVIVLTSDKTAEVKSLQLGAVDFIPKPYDLPDVILARIGRAIELAEDTVTIHETETDSLTGLYTKAFFQHYAKKHDYFFPDMEMDAVVININRFHLINDLYGRVYGDKVLSALAAIIKKIADETDGIACRAESDKFELYIPHRDDHEEIINTNLELFARSIMSRQVIVRIGIYKNVDRTIPFEQRFDRATFACNKLRNMHHSTYGLYDTKMRETEVFTERLILDLEDALAEGQFTVYFQPKYDVRGDKPRLTSAEALVRWVHPSLGMISPGIFIPVFEENGMIQKVDRYVWRAAAAQIREWKNKFGKSIPVSVNVSRIDLFEPMLDSELHEILESNGLSADDFFLEITESAYTENSQQIISTVQYLREKGFSIEMDDFGTGYSSLNMLTSMPIDALKLDMKFVRNICSSEKDYRLVKMVIEIAEFLEIPTIAEGVETEEQYLLLKKAGCDIVQGYYFSKPVPPDEFEKLIEEELSC